MLCPLLLRDYADTHVQIRMCMLATRTRTYVDRPLVLDSLQHVLFHSPGVYMIDLQTRRAQHMLWFAAFCVQARQSQNMGGLAPVFWAERTQNIERTLHSLEKRFRKWLVEKREKKKQGGRPFVYILLRTGGKGIRFLYLRSGLDLLIASLKPPFGI